MAIIKPFKGLRPPQKYVELVESRPYDVLDSEEARIEAGDNEMSLYHIIKPEINFPQVRQNMILAFMKVPKSILYFSKKRVGLFKILKKSIIYMLKL